MDESTEATYNKLIEKSKEAFVLALEVYNRPSIKYRVEGFSFFVCNAWELMLKARIIAEKGIGAVYYKDSSDRTIMLEQCVRAVFTNRKDPLRKNLEEIIHLRNTSTHFVTEEYEQIYIGLFQACVTNFDEKMLEFHGVRMSDAMPQHFLTLSISASPISPEIVRAKYSPEIAEKVLFDTSRVAEEQALLANQRFSTVMATDIAIVKNPNKADLTVSIDNSSERAIRTAKEYRDPHNTHPLTVKAIVERVNLKLESSGIVLKAHGEPKPFTTNDWSLFSKYYGVKDDRRLSYRHVLGANVQYTYSHETVGFIVDTIAKDPDGVIDGLKERLRKK